MFKNACFFRVAEDFVLPDLAALERVLQKSRFVPCGPTQPESTGWVPPRGNKSKVMAESVAGHLILKQCTEKRAVPSSAIKAAVEEKIERYKLETGNERVPARLKKDFKEEVLLDLLPRAFSKRSTTLLWLDPRERLLVVDAGSLAAADRIVSSLLAALLEVPGAGPALDLQLVQTQTSPAASMSHWLVTREAPWRFTVDRDCELKAPDEQKSTVRYSRHTLDIDEVAEHIAAGKMPTQLALTWNDRVSFVLSDAGQLRKLKMLDVVVKEADDTKGKDDEGFDTNAAILTGELSALIPDLLEALGGELSPGAAPVAELALAA
ncbi:recombination-associated protein RdgC [Ramlibacter alkalitolerans]|uniref:Recombination-associated protein RdgC n=1 Tax=Ramlibacter alkalitolerans TaxID=2039631 RepID=A0ABS1JLH8_9BURK|nr:recombination-associated protein RdgC [Ramlibacter alkalitolerans]MBL0424771.1 recombination-associated protein RdgC [Ramlibacter alkalitolerans]